MKVALYPGSFDPLTKGHLDVIERAASLFDKVIVAVAHNDQKQPLFSVEERVAMIETAIESIPHTSVTSFGGLLVNYARTVDAACVVRGLRAVSDFEFEFQLALMNRRLDPKVETIFLTPKEEFSYVSSRLVKEIARLGGQVTDFVPKHVATALRNRFSPNHPQP